MGLTLDTGAVIALEEGQRGKTSERRLAFMRALAEPDARLERVRVTIPSVVIAEWWRARPGQPWGSIVETDYRIEMFDAATAKVVGALLEKVAKAGKLARFERATRERLLLVDAAVVVGAARRGDLIYTVDGTDIARLAGLHGYDENRVKYL